MAGNILHILECVDCGCSGQVDDVLRSGAGDEARDTIRAATILKYIEIIAAPANQRFVRRRADQRVVAGRAQDDRRTKGEGCARAALPHSFEWMRFRKDPIY